MASNNLPREPWHPDVHRRLVSLLAQRHASPLAVFDWDDTVIEGDLSLAMLRISDAAEGTTWFEDYHTLLKTEGRAVAYPQITRWYAGLTPQEFLAFTHQVVGRSIEDGSVRIRPAMRNLVEALTGAGWEIHVVTASPALLVTPMAQLLGIPSERVHGMRLRCDANGVMTDVLDGPATFEEGKRQVVLQRMDRRPTLVAGDSSSDLPMMELAEHVLLIDGHDRSLRARAQQEGWMIQSGWQHTPAEHGVR